MTRSGAFSTVLLLLWFPAVCFGEADLERVREHDELAQELFDAGDFEGALQEMGVAQALMPASSRLYNTGVCHERLGQLQEAIDLFVLFTEDTDVPAERRDRTLLRLEQLRDQLETDADDAPDDVEGRDALRAREAQEAQEAENDDDNETSTPVARRWWFWTIIASVVVVSVGAVTAGVLLTRESPAPQPVLGFDEHFDIGGAFVPDEMLRIGGEK